MFIKKGAYVCRLIPLENGILLGGAIFTIDGFDAFETHNGATSLHANQKARGTNEKEIVDVINTGFSIPAKYGRVGKAKIYDFKQSRHNIYYEQKRVEVFYIVNGNAIITATVYVFYGKWEG
jgi:hypothetical protein